MFTLHRRALPSNHPCELRLSTIRLASLVRWLLTLVRAAADAGTPYDAVLLLLGTNDFLRDAYDSLLRNLQTLHAAVRATGATTVALGLPQSRASESAPERAAALRRLNEGIASSGGASLLAISAGSTSLSMKASDETTVEAMPETRMLLMNST